MAADKPGDRAGEPNTLDELEALGRATREYVLGESKTSSPASPGIAATTYRTFADRTVWGGAWARPGLDPRVRSACTLAVVATLGAEDQVRTHIRGALRLGMTPAEITEILLQVGVYAGAVRAAQAFRWGGEILDGSQP